MSAPKHSKNNSCLVHLEAQNGVQPQYLYSLIQLEKREFQWVGVMQQDVERNPRDKQIYNGTSLHEVNSNPQNICDAKLWVVSVVIINSSSTWWEWVAWGGLCKLLHPFNFIQFFCIFHLWQIIVNIYCTLLQASWFSNFGSWRLSRVFQVWLKLQTVVYRGGEWFPLSCAGKEGGVCDSRVSSIQSFNVKPCFVQITQTGFVYVHRLPLLWQLFTSVDSKVVVFARTLSILWKTDHSIVHPSVSSTW